jgi:hypothetical protein
MPTDDPGTPPSKTPPVTPSPTAPSPTAPPAATDPSSDPWLQIALKAVVERKLPKPTPPAGVSPGTPEYDSWYNAWAVNWFRAGVAAGDADLMRRAGITTKSEGGGANDLIAPWENSAPSSEWLGKRAPTAGELRRYAKDKNQSEDYARFPDRVLAKWIKEHWQVKEGHFTNDFGDVVEKPTESGAKSNAAGYPTGLKNPEGSGGGGTGGGSGGGGTNTAPPTDNPLTNKLLLLWKNGAGQFATDPVTGANTKPVATTLPNDALWWGNQTAPQTTPPPSTNPFPTTTSNPVQPAPAPTTPATPATSTPVFFGAGTTGAPTFPTSPTTAPSSSAPPSTPTNPASPTQPDFSKFVVNKSTSNPLVDALMKAAFPKLPQPTM